MHYAHIYTYNGPHGTQMSITTHVYICMLLITCKLSINFDMYVVDMHLCVEFPSGVIYSEENINQPPDSDICPFRQFKFVCYVYYYVYHVCNHPANSISGLEHISIKTCILYIIYEISLRIQISIRFVYYD